MDCEKKHKQIEGVTLNQNHRDGKDMCTRERVFCLLFHACFVSRSHLHYDSHPGLLCGVEGTKRVRLWKPG